MPARLRYLLFLAAVLLAWWVGDHWLTPWLQRLTHVRDIHSRALAIILSHWVIDQGPRVVLCLALWLLGTRLGLMPSLRSTLGSGGSWRRVLSSGVTATGVILALFVLLVLGTGGSFGLHPDFPKMAGDLISNLYEEVVYRGLMLGALYGLGAGAALPLDGPRHPAGLVTGVLGSSVIFGLAHEQYALPLQVVTALVGLIFALPWIKARSLWAAWLPHTLGDVIGDTFMAL